MSSEEAFSEWARLEKQLRKLNTKIDNLTSDQFAGPGGEGLMRESETIVAKMDKLSATMNYDEVTREVF